MKEVKLPSGATLKITPGSFAESRALYMTCLEEVKSLPVHTEMQISGLVKDLVATMFSSRKVEAALFACLRRCTYNDNRMQNVDEIFEDEKAREDFVPVCLEVAEVNLAPFMKSLFAVYSHQRGRVESVLASRLQTTPS